MQRGVFGVRTPEGLVVVDAAAAEPGAPDESLRLHRQEVFIP